jgi:glycosyltransferase involved in cell wall biosynthesis
LVSEQVTSTKIFSVEKINNEFSSMRIVIDLQGAQSSNSRNRGIGRYTLSLVLAILENSKDHEIILALNGAFQDSIQSIREAVSRVSQSVEFAIWQPPRGVRYDQMTRANVRKAAEFVREAFLISLDPSVIVITSLFEGCDDDAVTSVGRLKTSVPTVVILYDLIPLVNSDLYLGAEGAFSNWYFEKVRHLKNASALLAISESSRNEAIDHLGFDPENVVSISTAADSHFVAIALTAEQQGSLRKKYGLPRPFAMYTGGIERRKNIEKLIAGYAQLPASLIESHQLAIVCSASEFDKKRLTELAYSVGLKPGDVVLTGYVPEQDLVELYSLCKLFVFPSWHEGFGLPALEAMRCGAAVIAANTSSLPEVVGLDEAMFNPHDLSAIAQKLEQAISDDQFLARLKTHGLERSKLFTWDASARMAVSALEQIVVSTQAEALPVTKKPRLAYLSPLPSERSGISDYSAELLPYLAKYYDIDVIVAQDTVTSKSVKVNCEIRSIDWFSANRDVFDRVLYHFGNSHFHAHMHSLIREIPGTIVLHDFYLSDFIHHNHMSNPGLRTIERAVYSSHGYPALAACSEQHWSNAIVSTYPCSFDPIASSLGVIVHSENSLNLASKWYGIPHKDWDVIPLLRIPAATSLGAKSEARTKLNLAEDDFVVCSFGFAAPTKLSLELYDAWANSDLASDAKCVLVFVGDRVKTAYGEKLQAKIDGHTHSSRVVITGWAEEALFRDYLAAADVGVQLRTMSRGETSAAVLDCMNYGLATIVNANGSMAELPDDAVYKLRDDFEVSELTDALSEIRADTRKRERLGTNSQLYVQQVHAPAKCAREYFKAIEGRYANSESIFTNLTRLIADEVDMSNEDCIETASCIDFNLPPLYRISQHLIDVTCLLDNGYSDQSEAATRDWIRNALLSKDTDLRQEPIYYSAVSGGFKYARNYSLQLLGLESYLPNDEDVRVKLGDVCTVIGTSTSSPGHAAAVLALTDQGVEMRKLTPAMHQAMYT